MIFFFHERSDNASLDKTAESIRETRLIVIIFGSCDYIQLSPYMERDGQGILIGCVTCNTAFHLNVVICSTRRGSKVCPTLARGI
jgi:hypothetical protein